MKKPVVHIKYKGKTLCGLTLQYWEWNKPTITKRRTKPTSFTRPCKNCLRAAAS